MALINKIENWKRKKYITSVKLKKARGKNKTRICNMSQQNFKKLQKAVKRFMYLLQSQPHNSIADHHSKINMKLAKAVCYHLHWSPYPWVTVTSSSNLDTLWKKTFNASMQNFPSQKFVCEVFPVIFPYLSILLWFCAYHCYFISLLAL